MFQTLLGRLGDAPSYEKAAILERLGLCLHLAGRPDLAATHLRQAMGMTDKLDPGDGVKALRGILHSELGDVLRAAGELGDAKRAYEAALGIAEELNDARARSVDLMHLGGLALVRGDLEEARTRYQAALELLRQLHEPALEALARHQLGRVLHEMRRWNEAEAHYREAARIREERGNLAGAAQDWAQLAALRLEAGDGEAAEAWYRKAIAAGRQIEGPVQLARLLGKLAALLLRQPDRLDEARALVEEALGGGQAGDPPSPEVWRHYGILADVVEREAARAADDQRRVELEAQARAYRELHRHAPRIAAALARLDDASSYARAVILERLGQCFRIGRRPDRAIACLRDALGVTEKLGPGDEVRSLRGMLDLGLGEVLRAAGDYGEARRAYEAALRSAEASGDLRGQATALGHLGALAWTEGDLEQARTRYEVALVLWQRLHEPALEADAWRQLGSILQELRRWSEADRCHRDAVRAGEEPAGLAVAGGRADHPGAFEVALHEDLITDHVLEPDLLLDGPREQRIVRWTGAADTLADRARPMLVPGARTFLDQAGAVRFALPISEPALIRHPGCMVMRRTRREVAVTGDAGVLWRLIRRLDGACTVAEIRSGFPTAERGTAARLLGALTATGVIDVSGRPVGRFLHAATKKGVLPGGGLEKDEVMRLALDGAYRAYPDAPRLGVSRRVPDRLRDFHALTRQRRSCREYLGLAVSREDFDALLCTACGVTGAISRAGHEVKLRAYPSSGALYAVEIYPLVLAVEGLEPAVYHYRAVEEVLEVVKPGIDRARIVSAMLPVERGMVAGAAAMICLSGVFSRHERKYGEGGYRMMVAEAGHISQNLILAATALGLSARPFGGVFDALLNRELGLEEAEEQFLLAVLVGRPQGRDGP